MKVVNNRKIAAGAEAEEAVSDRGQATPLLLMMLFATVGLALVVAEVGRLLNESAQARTAADAAALAGAAEGEQVAAELAAANGGTMISYHEHDEDDGSSTVSVTVRVGRATQTARASAVVEWIRTG